jgi:dipeptidyl aminopeptidase/acylaminoacyl peptidase
MTNKNYFYHPAYTGMLLLLLVLLTSCAGQHAITETPKENIPIIPLKTFFKNPGKAAFTISPDGSTIAWLAPWKSRMNIFVKTLGESKAHRITSSTNRDISGYYWVGNKHIAYARDFGGDENFHTFCTAIDGSETKDLTPFKNTRTGLVDDLENDDSHILIEMNKRDPRIFDVYKVNVLNGKMKMVAKNPGNISGWMTDNDGRVRIAIAIEGTNNVILYRKNENEKFKPIIKTDFKTSFDPIFFGFDNKDLYVSTNIGRDKTAIYLFNPDTAKLEHLIFEHPDVDADILLRSKKRKVITGAGYYTDKMHLVLFDKKREDIQNFLEKKLKGYSVVLTSRNRDENRYIVRTYSDKSHGAAYLLDYPSMKLTKIADVSPWINEKMMSDMQPVSFDARDGLKIHGYLTLPLYGSRKNIPVVILPHGGPSARDMWGFNPEVQFLANRGMAVMQVNYRGSTGYGKNFWKAGFKQWGLKMQDDLTDAAHWLIKKGIADPKRVAIYGASYGGYATLAGLAFTPDLYACGVDYVGPSNLFTLLQTIPPYWEPARIQMYEMIGNPVIDKKLLRKVSPVFHADKIKAPLFIAQGAKDPRVKKDEADQIVSALKKQGIKVKYMVKKNEGHGFHNEENRFDFYRAMEKFFAAHLGTRSEELSAPVGK